MPPVDIAELERLARAAWPGPWEVHGGKREPLGACVIAKTVPRYVEEALSNVVYGIAWKDRPEPFVICDDEDFGVGAMDDQALANFAYIAAASPATILALVEEVRAIRALVDEQANDDGIWFIAQTGPEAYLQQELRRLHALIEGVTPDDCARSLLARAGEEK